MNDHRDSTSGRPAGRPSHPTKQAVVLLLGVTVLLIALALSSSTGHL